MENGGDHGRAGGSRGATSETRMRVAEKRDALREVAAAKSKGLRETAAVKAQAVRQTAVAKGGEMRTSAAGRGGEFGRSAAQRGAEIRRNMRNMDVPWARCAPARMARETILQFGLRPLMGMYTRLYVVGRERFDDVSPPVVLVANHSSHLDTPMILRALPRQWRQRTAVAAAADYFYKKRAVAHAVALIFNTVPIMRRGGGGVGNGAFDHVDRLIDERWNLLIFPEGTRSREGKLGRVRSGAAVIAQQHGIPIIPIHVKGTHDAMPPGRNWPKRVKGFFSRRHRVEIHFGPPIYPAAAEDPSQMMDRLRRHLEDGPTHGPLDREGVNGHDGVGDRDGFEDRVSLVAPAVSQR
jgi:1-acyl-sn-glycerol-3-phosphate acyltransferase